MSHIYEYFRTKVQSFCIAAYIVGTEVSTKFSGRSFSRPMASELLIAAPPKKIKSMALESKIFFQKDRMYDGMC